MLHITWHNLLLESCGCVIKFCLICSAKVAISTAYYCSNVVWLVKMFVYILCAVQESESSRADVMLDVDPEIIRKGVRTLMQQVAQIERERVSHSLLYSTVNIFCC